MKKTILILFLIVTLSITIDGQVIVTEFLADPKAPLESEWIELYNLSSQNVNLEGWSLCDLVDCAEIDSINIKSGQYITLCQDSSAFRSYYYSTDIELYEIPGWRALNNSGDIIVLNSSDDMMADSISYETGNGDNISWERIDNSLPGWDPENWNPSLDSTGSTPGRENSVAGGFAENFMLRLLNKVFAPGSGGEDQYLAIEIELPRDCTLTLTVYSLDGRKIVTIYDEQMLISGEYFYNGHDADGDFLDVGMYILLAQTAGGCNQSEKYVFGVARK